MAPCRGRFSLKSGPSSPAMLYTLAQVVIWPGVPWTQKTFGVLMHSPGRMVSSKAAPAQDRCLVTGVPGIVTAHYRVGRAYPVRLVLPTKGSGLSICGLLSLFRFYLPASCILPINFKNSCRVRLPLSPEGNLVSNHVSSVCGVVTEWEPRAPEVP